MPAVGRLSGTPASISASEEPQTDAIDEEPFELGDLGNDADRVGEFGRRRQHRMDRAPGELAVADFAATGRADASGFTHRIRREVVMQQECLFVGSLQRVDELLVFGCAERRHHQRLRLTAGEQCGAVGTWQHADFGDDRAHSFEVTAVDTFVGVEDVPTHNLGFELLEHAGNRELVIFWLGAFREEMCHHLFLHGGNGVLAVLLLHDRVGGAQVLFGEAEDFLLQRFVVRNDQFARLLCSFFSELDDGLDHRLKVPVSEHHGTEHDLFGQLFGFRFHHHHRVIGTGDDEIELTFRHLVECRIEDILVVDEADASAANRAHKRRAGQCERGGGRNHGDDVGIVLHVVRKHGDCHLGIATPAFGEQRSDRAIDQARGQCVLFGRTALALEVAAGNTTGRVIFFGVVDGEWEEIDSFLRLLGRHYGGEHGRLAVGGEYRTVGLARYAACLEG